MQSVMTSKTVPNLTFWSLASDLPFGC